jgi:hypothetical protein
VKETVTCPLPAIAERLVGASGIGTGMTELETAEMDVPTESMATIEKVYDVPLVNPVTRIGLVDPVAVIPPGEDVIEYEVAYVDPVKEILA